MNRLASEIEVFCECPRSMQILILANMIYAFVLPVIEIFVAAYVMRNSHEVSKVIVYQLSIYAATPAAFYANGKLLGRVAAKHLYATGMLLSGIAIFLMMQLSVLTPIGVSVSGITMGLATGIFWANRGLLALTATNNENRNYYYGVENFFAALAAVIVPALIGWFISSTSLYGWLGGAANRAYHIIAVVVLCFTVLAAWTIERGSFRKTERTPFVFFHFHPIWWRMLELALLKGLAQGYIVTAPAMLIMLLLGKEGTLGAIQASGGVISAIIMYMTGRLAEPHHRTKVFAVAVSLFLMGAVVNAALFNAAGVMVFMACLVVAKPLLDLAYYPIQLQVVDAVSQIEKRNEYAYIFNHEFGLFFGRSLGCGLFLALASLVSSTAALKYALTVIALLQVISIWVTVQISHRQSALLESYPEVSVGNQLPEC
jgi:MFS transporter, YQGE family, putative transporter